MLVDKYTGGTPQLFMVLTVIGLGTGKASHIVMAVQLGYGQMGHKNGINMANYTETMDLPGLNQTVHKSGINMTNYTEIMAPL
jgi:hypothetical protein